MIRTYLKKRNQNRTIRKMADIACEINFIDQCKDTLPCHVKPMADRREQLQAQFVKLNSKLNDI